MSLFGLALGGLGAGAADLANKYIDKELQEQKAAALAEIQRKSTLQTEAGLYAQQNAPARLEAQRQAAEANARAAARVKRDLDVENMTDPRLREATQSQADFERPIKAADIEAQTRAKNAGTPFDAGPGGQRWVDGKLVAENKRLTGPEVSMSLYEQGLKSDAGKGGTRTAKADHFTEKEWDAVRKPPKEIVSFGDEMSGKSIPSGALMQVYRESVTSLQQRGDVGPNEAADIAGARALKLRQKAEELVAAARAKDRKSTLTEEQAVTQLLRANEQAFAAAQRQQGGAQAANPAVQQVPNPMQDAAPATAPPSLASVAAAKQDAAAPAPAATTKPAAAPAIAPKVDLETARQQVASLRDQERQAARELQAYGMRQRSADPAGFRAAQALLDATRQQREAAERQLAIVERTASDEAVRPRAR